MSRYRGSERFCRYTVSPLRKRKFVPGVDGEGTLVSMPMPYYGSMYTDATGIVVDDVEMLYNDTHSPCHIKAHLNIRFAGTRRFSGLPLKETLCHIVWTLTHADGSPVAYHNEIVEQYTGETKNPYTDIFGPVFGCALFDYGDFILTGTAYIATATGQCLVASKSIEFSRAEQVVTKLFYNVNDGFNTNDGRHPLTIPALTNATYTESTGYLTQTDAFTDLVLQDETGIYIENSRNWIYLPGHGLKHIAEKVDNSTIRLSDGYKLGADYTGLTSSNGPKQTYTRMGTDETNFIHCFSGADNQIHEITAKTVSHLKRERFGWVGYDGEAHLRPATGMTDELLFWQQTPSAVRSPSHVILDNIKIDGDNRSKTIGGALTRADASGLALITRNWQCVDSLRPTAFSITKGADYTGDINWVDQNSNYRNIRLVNINCTVVEAISGATQITVNGDLTQMTTGDGSFLLDGVRYIISSYALSGSDYVLQISQTSRADNNPHELVNSYSAGTPLVVSERRVHGIFCALDNFTFLGQKFETDSDAPTYDHHCYPSIKKGNNLAAWGWGKPTSDAGFMYNFNNDSGSIVHRNSFIQNFAQGCEYFLDAGENNNNPTDNTFTGLYAVGNAGNPESGFIFQSCGVDWFVALNNIWSATPKWSNQEVGGGEKAFFSHLVISELLATIQSVADWDFVVERNNAKNYKAWADNGQARIVNLALLDNHVEQDQTASNTININTSGSTSVVIEGNNFTAPNDADGNYLRVNGATLSLAAFNTAIGYDNTGDTQDWNDPANGDFSPAGESVPEAPTGLNVSPGDTVLNAGWTLSASTGGAEPTGQRIYFNTVDDFETATQFGSNLSSSETTAQITGLTNGTTYYVWITAFNTNGESAPSTVDSATPRLPELILGGGTKYATLTGFNQSSTNDKVGGDDDFDFSYTFKFLDTPSFTRLFSPVQGINVLRLTDTTTIRWADNAGNFDFTVPEMVIGQEYEHIWRRRSGVLSLEHNGVVNASTPTTNAILNWSLMASSTSTPVTQRVVMKNVSLTRLATPWTIGYNIDGGQVPTPPATSVTVAADVSTGTTDSHSITYHGIDADDWVYE